MEDGRRERGLKDKDKGRSSVLIRPFNELPRTETFPGTIKGTNSEPGSVQRLEMFPAAAQIVKVILCGFTRCCVLKEGSDVFSRGRKQRVESIPADLHVKILLRL